MKLASKMLKTLEELVVEKIDSVCYYSEKDAVCKTQTKETSQEVKLAQKILSPNSTGIKTKSYIGNTLQGMSSLKCSLKNQNESNLIPFIYSSKDSVNKIITRFKNLNRDNTDSEDMFKLLKSGEFDSKLLKNIEKVPVQKKSGESVKYWGRLKLHGAVGVKSVRVIGVVEVYARSVLFHPTSLDTRENTDYADIRTLPANTLLQEDK